METLRRSNKIEVSHIPTGRRRASAKAYVLNDATLQNATVYVTPGYTDGIGDFWTNITVMPASDMLSATISISDVLKSLIWNGIITGQEYISGVEFGAEPVGLWKCFDKQLELSMER